eukprot:15481085-Alexandrium_andersonii.AAC.1
MHSKRELLGRTLTQAERRQVIADAKAEYASRNSEPEFARRWSQVYAAEVSTRKAGCPPSQREAGDGQFESVWKMGCKQLPVHPCLCAAAREEGACQKDEDVWHKSKYSIFPDQCLESSTVLQGGCQMIACRALAHNVCVAGVRSDRAPQFLELRRQLNRRVDALGKARAKSAEVLLGVLPRVAGSECPLSTLGSFSRWSCLPTSR